MERPLDDDEMALTVTFGSGLVAIPLVSYSLLFNTAIYQR